MLKKHSLFSVLSLTVGFAVFAAPMDDDKYVDWLSGVTEGYYNDSANWTDGILPENGKDGFYGRIDIRTHDVTVKVPKEGLVENSGMFILGESPSRDCKFTIDTRGTFWEKKGVVAVNNWWGVGFANNLNSGSHVFNFEDFSSTANNSTVFRFENALFEWNTKLNTQNKKNSSEFHLREGKLKFNKAFYLGSSGNNVDFYIYPDASLEGTAAFQQRGNASTRTWFLGGKSSFGSLYLKDQNGSIGKTYVYITNDANVSLAYDCSLGACTRAQGDADKRGGGRGILELSETASLSVGRNLLVGGGANTYQTKLCNQGDLKLSGASTLSAANCFLGYSHSTTGNVVVADNAKFTVINSCAIGDNIGSWGSVCLTGNAEMTVDKRIKMAFGKDSYAEIIMDDDSRLSISPVNGNWISLGSNASTGSKARFVAGGRSRVTAGASTSVEMGYGLEDTDVEVTVKDDASFILGSNGYITNKVPVDGRSVVNIKDNATLALVGIYGSDPETGAAKMELNADGGTIHPSSTPHAPFISGCVATLGAGGLTLDTGSYDVEVDQAFVDEEEAAPVLTKKGSGKLIVKSDSTHATTRIEEGILSFGAGVSKFGRNLEFAKGTVLELASLDNVIQVEGLTLEDVLEITVPSDLEEFGTFEILEFTGEIPSGIVEKLLVFKPTGGKSYSFNIAEGSKKISMTVSAAAATAQKEWVGAQDNAWGNAENWSAAGVPGYNDEVTISKDAEITVSGEGKAKSLKLGANKNASVSGGMLYIGSSVTTEDNSHLTLAGSLRHNESLVTKNGLGLLSVTGDNSLSLRGGWNLERGITEFTTPEALGQAANNTDSSAIAVSNCTFRYAGEEKLVTKKQLKLTGELPAILDIVSDLTFDDFKISYGQGDGGIVKTGAGTLTFNVPEGTTTLSRHKDAPRKGNADISGSFAPVKGETANWNGVAQMTILDGTLKVVGKGKDVSIVKQEHHGGIGGSAHDSTTPPTLYVKDVKFIQGSGSGFHLLMGREMKKNSLAPRLIIDNANMECNGLHLGYNAWGDAGMKQPVLTITNGTLNVTWQALIPNNSARLCPYVRVGKGGELQRHGYAEAGGIWFYKEFDVRIEDGGMISVRDPQSLYLGDSAVSNLIFAAGGGMRVSRFLGMGANYKADFVLDGGWVEFTTDNGISTVNKPGSSSLYIDEGGGELIVAGVKTHVLAAPLRGPGKAVKKGTGTLVLTNDLSVSISDSSNHYKPVYAERQTNNVKVQNAGGIEIAEGTLRCEAGNADAQSRFSGKGVLEGDIPEFILEVEPGVEEGLDLTSLDTQKITLDFGCEGDEKVNYHETPSSVVAKVADLTMFNSITWRVRNCGDGMTAELSYDATTQLVTAQFKPSGFMVFIR